MVKSFSQGSQRIRRKAGQRRRSRTTRSRRVKRARSTEETERRILDAAHAVFVRAGTAGARTLEIAKEAGVNPALLHYYFRTKERLAEAVFRRAAGQLLPAVVRILGSDATLEDKVEQVVQVELQFLSKAPYLPAYILSELAHHPDRAPQLIAAVTGEVPVALGTQLRTVLAKQIDARVRDRTMHPISPDQFAVNLLALCVFPFAARPLFMALFGIDETGIRAVHRPTPPGAGAILSESLTPMSASRAVRRVVIVILGFVFLLPGSMAAQPAATAPRTFELAALQRAAIESDPRMRQLRLLMEQSELRLRNIAVGRLPAVGR